MKEYEVGKRGRELKFLGKKIKILKNGGRENIKLQGTLYTPAKSRINMAPKYNRYWKLSAYDTILDRMGLKGAFGKSKNHSNICFCLNLLTSSLKLIFHYLEI